MYHLIDTDTRKVVAVAETEVKALAACPYLPADCVPGAATWEEVLDVARKHADGVPGVVDGYCVERAPETATTYDGEVYEVKTV